MPNRDDVRFRDVELEVGAAGDGVEGTDKGGEGFPEIGNDEGGVVGISGENVGSGEGGGNKAEKAICNEEVNCRRGGAALANAGAGGEGEADGARRAIEMAIVAV